jgi:protein XagA
MYQGTTFAPHVPLIGLLVLLMCSPALSGAYLENRGTGLLIFSGRLDEARVSLSSKGQPLSAISYNRLDTTTNLELGINERATFLFSAGLTKASYADSEQWSYYLGRSITEIGARFKLVRGADWILSAQSTLLLPNGACSCISAVSSETLYQQDDRLLLGKNFAIGTHYPLYAEIQFGQRFRQAHSVETHVDTSLAWRPKINWMILAQTFTNQSPADSQTPRISQTKAQISLIYDLSAAISLQFAGFKTILARNALSEQGGLMAIWLHF